MFDMKNREFTFIVDDAEIDCGLNEALDFVQMNKDGRKSKHSKCNDIAGAKYGISCCDAQRPHDMKGIHGRANVADWVPSETDESTGRGQTFYGLYGPDIKYKFDATNPVTVTTQFIAADVTDSGKLTEMKHSDKMCVDKVHETKDGTNFLARGRLQTVYDAFTAGAVLVVSVGNDHDANVLWLGSNYSMYADLQSMNKPEMEAGLKGIKVQADGDELNTEPHSVIGRSLWEHNMGRSQRMRKYICGLLLAIPANVCAILIAQMRRDSPFQLNEAGISNSAPGVNPPIHMDEISAWYAFIPPRLRLQAHQRPRLRLHTHQRPRLRLRTHQRPQLRLRTHQRPHQLDFLGMATVACALGQLDHEHYAG